jgi:hypothetical protein
VPPQQGRRHDLPPLARANDHEPPAPRAAPGRGRRRAGLLAVLRAPAGSHRRPRGRRYDLPAGRRRARAAAPGSDRPPCSAASLRNLHAVTPTTPRRGATARHWAGTDPDPGAGTDRPGRHLTRAAAPVSRHLSATVRRGQWLIIEGRSGAGRSTLRAALLGHLLAMEGSWQANGSGSTAFDAGQLRRRIAWCPRRRTCSTPPSAATVCSPEDRTTRPPRRRARGSRPRGLALLTRADVMLLGEPTPTSTPPPPTRSGRTCGPPCPTASSSS